MKIKSYIEAPRFAHIGIALRKAALGIGVDITIDTEKHLLRETVFFEVSGNEERINRFSTWLESAIKEYEEETE